MLFGKRVGEAHFKKEPKEGLKPLHDGVSVVKSEAYLLRHLFQHEQTRSSLLWSCHSNAAEELGLFFFYIFF